MLLRAQEMRLATRRMRTAFMENILAPERSGSRVSVNRLQFFPRLKPHGSSWRNRYLSSRARIAPNPRFTRTHVEHSKTPQLNAIAGRQRLLHAFKHGLHGQFCFRFRDAGLGDHFVDYVELDHAGLPSAGSIWSFK